MLKLKELPDFFKLICPQLIGRDMEFLKKIVALQLFSNPSVGEKVHILCCGDVASGKTILASWLEDVVPNSRYVTKRVTEVGMCDSLIASNSGILVVDELDKIPKQIREQMLEAMQTGKVTTTKHKYYSKQDAKVNVLAFCNPISYILQDTNILNMLPFKLPLLSRFHLFAKIPAPPKETYRDIAFQQETWSEEKDKELQLKIRDYLITAKKEIPIVELSSRAIDEIGRFVEYLKEVSPLKDLVSPRTIEGIRSCVKARARMMNRNNVTREDLNYVFSIFEECLR